jgi:hypothetical protein
MSEQETKNQNPMDNEEVWNKLEAFGVRELKEQDANALNNRQITDMIKFSISDFPEVRKALESEKVEYRAKGGKLNFNGKLQIVESQGEGVSIMMIPKRKEIKNDFGFAQPEWEKLQKGELLHEKDVKGNDRLYQLDKDTNNVLSVKSKDIKLPETIAGVKLTEKQIEELKQGKDVDLKMKTNQTITTRLDLNEKSGLHIKNEQGRKVEIELKQEQQGKEQKLNLTDDKQRLEHIAQRGIGSVSEDKEFNRKYGFDKIQENFNRLNKDMQEHLKKHNSPSDAIGIEIRNVDKEAKQNAANILAKQEQQQEKKPEIRLTDDAQRLEHIANNGIKGAQEIYPNNAQMRGQFFDKYNLSTEINRVNEIGKLSPSDTNKQNSSLSTELNNINEGLKNKASAELERFKMAEKQELKIKI